MKESYKDLKAVSQIDRNILWHPFSHQKDFELPVTIVKGEGSYLIDEQGNKYIDAFSSWWVNLHGHSHPYIAKKIYEQAITLEHVAFSDFTHKQAVKLGKRLLEYLPPNQAKVFYSDNGSTAVEVALKMAIQYNYNLRRKNKRIIAFENGYHGDTFGAMSVAERNVFNHPFSGYLFNVTLIPIPTKTNSKSLNDRLRKELKKGDVCAFIYEPLVQGAGGMIMYDSDSLDSLIEVCKEFKCITIADEVMTGFYRTGCFLASDHCKNNPDIICLAKGITGGFLPLGVTTATKDIHSAFVSVDKNKTFYHGHSYTANPIACAAANANLDLIGKPGTKNKIKWIAERFEKFKKNIHKHPALLDCRQMGTILAMEIKSKEGTSYLNPMSDKIKRYFFKRGIIVRPLGNILYFIPPYCITDKEITMIENCTYYFLNSLL